jgi:hypothetical protein
MMEKAPEKKCVLCGAVLEGVAEAAAGEFRCVRCGTRGRYDTNCLVAIYIPNYHARLAELEVRNRELVSEIELEGMKGENRDMRFLQKKHLERQDVLAEVAFLSHFREFVEKW